MCFYFSQAVNGKENKAPAQRFRWEIPKVQSLAAQPTKNNSRTFGVTNKGNVKGSILTGPPHQSVSCGPAQHKLNQNSVFRSTYTVSAKSNLNPASHLKKKPNVGTQSSVRASLNAAPKGLTTSNSRPSSSTIAAWSGPVKTLNPRISLGPIVKTKTGLIPAVIQPRTANSHLKHTSAKAADGITNTTAAKKTISRISSSVSVLQSSAMAPRKIPPSTVVNKPVNDRTTVSSTARPRKVPDEHRSNFKPLLVKHSQPSCRIQPPNVLKSTTMSSKSKVAPIKPVDKLGVSKTAAGQLTESSTHLRSVGRGEKNVPPRKVPHQALKTGTKPAAVADLGGKTANCRETQNGNKHSSAKIPGQQTFVKKNGFAMMSKTAPQPARTVSFTGRSKDKALVIPQTEGKKVTAAQEERM